MWNCTWTPESMTRKLFCPDSVTIGKGGVPERFSAEGKTVEVTVFIEHRNGGVTGVKKDLMNAVPERNLEQG